MILQEIHRQQSGSPILDACEMVLAGKIEEAKAFLPQVSRQEMAWLASKGVPVIAGLWTTIEALTAEIRASLNYDPANIYPSEPLIVRERTVWDGKFFFERHERLQFLGWTGPAWSVPFTAEMLAEATAPVRAQRDALAAWLAESAETATAEEIKQAEESLEKWKRVFEKLGDGKKFISSIPFTVRRAQIRNQEGTTYEILIGLDLPEPFARYLAKGGFEVKKKIQSDYKAKYGGKWAFYLPVRVGYIQTCHGAQGQEFANLVVLDAPGPGGHQRWFYTAFSRAKSNLWVCRDV